MRSLVTVQRLLLLQRGGERRWWEEERRGRQKARSRGRAGSPRWENGLASWSAGSILTSLPSGTPDVRNRPSGSTHHSCGFLIQEMGRGRAQRAACGICYRGARATFFHSTSHPGPVAPGCRSTLSTQPLGKESLSSEVKLPSIHSSSI